MMYHTSTGKVVSSGLMGLYCGEDVIITLPHNFTAWCMTRGICLKKEKKSSSLECYEGVVYFLLSRLFLCHCEIQIIQLSFLDDIDERTV